MLAGNVLIEKSWLLEMHYELSLHEKVEVIRACDILGTNVRSLVKRFKVSK